MTIITRNLGFQEYHPTWEKMKQFTDTRNEHSKDEIWLLEHPPVFTQGQAGKAEHILDPGDIPVVQSDRGGQVTYHGPGQLVAYIMVDMRRRNMTTRDLVTAIEQAVIETLADYSLQAKARRDAPGVYIDNAKVCSIGLRIRKGCSYHGIAFNIDMDLSPFKRINPCGFKQLAMTQLSAFVATITLDEVATPLVKHLNAQINQVSHEHSQQKTTS